MGGATVRLETSLSASDRRRVEDILKRFETSGKVSVTLSGLLDEWRRLSSSIAHDNWSLNTLNTGLRTRNLLEEILESLSMEGRRAVQTMLAEIDRDFIKVTYDPLRSDDESPVQSEIGWWQYRIPRDSCGTLDLGVPELGLSIEPPIQECGGLLG
jgi:hypothetical protein